jgi:hypothetical protein
VADPAPVFQTLEHVRDEIDICELVFFEKVDALLVLQDHVKTDYHCLFEVWVGNLWVEEVLGDESDNLSLIGGPLKTSCVY